MSTEELLKELIEQVKQLKKEVAKNHKEILELSKTINSNVDSMYYYGVKIK